LNLHRLYLVAGIFWALLAGGAAALAAFAFAAGVSWVFLFGDEPWPAAVQWVLPLLALFVGLIVFAAVLIMVSRYGRMQAAAQSANPVRERRKAILLVFAPLMLIALGAASAWLRARDYSADLETVSKREQALADLVAANQKVVAVDIMSDASDLNAVVRINGQRSGLYHLVMRVLPATGNAIVLTEDRSLQLPVGESDVEVNLKMSEVQQAYRDAILKGRGGVLVDELFRLDVSLVPALAGDEIATLPPNERGRLESADSPLQSRRMAQFPVHFTLAQ